MRDVGSAGFTWWIGILAGNDHPPTAGGVSQAAEWFVKRPDPNGDDFESVLYVMGWLVMVSKSGARFVECSPDLNNTLPFREKADW
jgi:hypothetical protein